MANMVMLLEMGDLDRKNPMIEPKGQLQDVPLAQDDFRICKQ